MRRPGWPGGSSRMARATASGARSGCLGRPVGAASTGRWRRFGGTAARPVESAAEDSPSGLGRTIGNRVGGDPSRVQIPYPPPPRGGHPLPGAPLWHARGREPQAAGPEFSPPRGRARRQSPARAPPRARCSRRGRPRRGSPGPAGRRSRSGPAGAAAGRRRPGRTRGRRATRAPPRDVQGDPPVGQPPAAAPRPAGRRCAARSSRVSGVEHHDVVEPVEELRLERAARTTAMTASRALLECQRRVDRGTASRGSR